MNKLINMIAALLAELRVDCLDVALLEQALGGILELTNGEDDLLGVRSTHAHLITSASQSCIIHTTGSSHAHLLAFCSFFFANCDLELVFGYPDTIFAKTVID